MAPSKHPGFEVERSSPGDRDARDPNRRVEWLLFRCAGDRREWCQTFALKRDAVAAACELSLAERPARLAKFEASLAASAKRATAEDRAAADSRRLPEDE